MQVYGVNPRRRVRRNPLAGTLMTLTNPRRRRNKRNPWHTGASGTWEQYNEPQYVPSYERRKRAKRSNKITKATKGKRTVAKRRKSRKRSTWMSLVKKHGIKAAKSLYRKMKGGAKRTRVVHRKRHYRKHRRPVATLTPRKHRRTSTIKIRARRPIKVWASNPRKRRHYRKRSAMSVIYKRNPRFPKVGISSDVVTRTAMVAAGFFGHRVLSNFLTRQLAKWNVPQWAVDVGIPVTAYIAMKQFKPLKNKVKYSNELLIGASVSAANRLAKKLLPENSTWGQYLGADTSSVLVLPGSVAGYQVGGYQVGGVRNTVLGGNSDPFLLGGYSEDDAALEE